MNAPTARAIAASCDTQPLSSECLEATGAIGGAGGGGGGAGDGDKYSETPLWAVAAEEEEEEEEGVAGWSLIPVGTEGAQVYHVGFIARSAI
jgi:hypothetical protein